MAHDWVEKRFEQYQDKADEQERRVRLDHRAKGATDEMISRLFERIEQDVETYNKYFKQNPCRLTTIADGVMVAPQIYYPATTLRLTKDRIQGFASCQYETRSSSEAPLTTHKVQLELRADYGDGQIDYVLQHKQQRKSRDVSEVSEWLLDPVFKGPRDFSF